MHRTAKQTVPIFSYHKAFKDSEIFPPTMSYLPVATFRLRADGETEASTARYIRDHKKFEPLIPTWITGLHHLAALWLTQCLCAVVDTGFDVDLKQKQNLAIVHKIKSKCSTK